MSEAYRHTDLEQANANLTIGDVVAQRSTCSWLMTQCAGHAQSLRHQNDLSPDL